MTEQDDVHHSETLYGGKKTHETLDTECSKSRDRPRIYPLWKRALLKRIQKGSAHESKRTNVQGSEKIYSIWRRRKDAGPPVEKSCTSTSPRNACEGRDDTKGGRQSRSSNRIESEDVPETTNFDEREGSHSATTNEGSPSVEPIENSRRDDYSYGGESEHRSIGHSLSLPISSSRGETDSQHTADEEHSCESSGLFVQNRMCGCDTLGDFTEACTLKHTGSEGEDPKQTRDNAHGMGTE